MRNTEVSAEEVKKREEERRQKKIDLLKVRTDFDAPALVEPEKGGEIVESLGLVYGQIKLNTASVPVELKKGEVTTIPVTVFLPSIARNLAMTADGIIILETAVYLVDGEFLLKSPDASHKITAHIQVDKTSIVSKTRTVDAESAFRLHDILELKKDAALSLGFVLEDGESATVNMSELNFTIQRVE